MTAFESAASCLRVIAVNRKLHSKARLSTALQDCFLLTVSYIKLSFL